MRQSRIILPLAVALVAGAGVTASGYAAGGSDCASPPVPTLAFEPPVFVDTNRPGGEPVSVVAKDGSIIAGAHMGTTQLNLRTVPDPAFVAGYANQTLIWRSTDDGKTWQRIELAPGVAAHSATSTGFSDPDWAIDSAGNLYGTEINLANVSVFSSHDNGKTWPDANPVADSGDRPWLAARGPNELYLRITGNLQKSTDGGKTFTKLKDPSAYGKIFVDPNDPKGLYAGSQSGVGVQVSRDDGLTWKSYAISGASNNSVMKSIGVGNDGGVYYGYVQGADVKFSSFDPAKNTWSSPVAIPRTGTGTPFWAWTVAGDDGRAAVAWYEASPVAGSTNQEIRAYVAVTQNARGSVVACSEGSSKVPPTFGVADAVGRPVHTGQFPCNGTGCNISGDRRLGDFFTVNFDRLGRAFILTGDTTIMAPAGGLAAEVSRPLFARATDASTRLLAR